MWAGRLVAVMSALWCAVAAADDVPSEWRFDMTRPQPERRLGTVEQTDTALGGKHLAVQAEQLAEQPDLLKRAVFSAVIQNQSQALELMMPYYRRLPENEQEPLLLHLADAIAARKRGDFTAAAASYRAALTLAPDLTAVRLALLQMLVEDRQDRAAERELAYLQDSWNLPEQAAASLQYYREVLQQRQSWRFAGGLNYIRDRNVNNASTTALHMGQGVWTPPPAQQAEGLAYRAAAARDWAVGGHWLVRHSAEANGKFYWNAHRYDDLLLRGELGLARRTARSEAAWLPYVERRWYGTRPYSRGAGIRGEWSYWLKPHSQLLLAAEWGRERYRHRRYLDGNTATVSATWLQLQGNRYWTFGSDYSRKSARDSSDAYRRYAVRSSLTQYWQNGLAASAQASAALRRYDGADFFNILRRDREYAASLSLWHDKVQWRGLMPRLTAVWQQTKGNHPLYNYRKANVFIQINKNF